MRELTLQERKTISLNILSDIDRVCKRHGIQYFMAYGTLIGTIRHQGFIPWDDDIDIWIKWKDYKRLNEILGRETKYEVINLDIYKKCAIQFTKISDPSTLVERKDKTHGDFKRGVAVDIFPLCPFYDGVLFRCELKILATLNKTFSIYICQENATILDIRGKCIRIICKVLSCIGLNQLFWQRKTENLFNKQKDSELIFSPYSPYKLRDVHKRNSFDATTECLFEGALFDCPVGYDEILHQIYGDYMSLPPREKRISNHDIIAYMLDTDETII